MVTYEIGCNPATESCYTYCEDEACTEPSYYAYIEKYAATVYGQCGSDITECDAANECLPEDSDQCTITYCDPKIEECEKVAEGETEIESINETMGDESSIIKIVTDEANSSSSPEVLELKEDSLNNNLLP